MNKINNITQKNVCNIIDKMPDVTDFPTFYGVRKATLFILHWSANAIRFNSIHSSIEDEMEGN